MNKFILLTILSATPSSAGVTDTYRTIYNPFSSRLDYVTTTDTMTVSQIFWGDGTIQISAPSNGAVAVGTQPWIVAGGGVVTNSTSTNPVLIQSTLTVIGASFSVGKTTFVVLGGSIGIGTSGPTNFLTIVSTGFPNSSFQGVNAGGVNVSKFGSGPAIVVISSVISAQQGDSAIFIKQMQGLWNDPLFRIIDQNNGNSSPQIRIDAYAPNLELKNINPALVGGLEVAYEPFAIPKAGDYLQVNGRDGAGSQFDDIARWHRKGNVGAFNGGLGFNALQMFSTGTVLFNDGSDTNYVGFKSSPTVPAKIVWVLPAIDAPSGSAFPLVSDGKLALSFSSNVSSLNVTGPGFSVGTSTFVITQGDIGMGTASPSTSTTLTVYGLTVSSTPNPTISCSAGTGVITAESNSVSGEFVAGAGAANCTLTFSAPWPKKPKCFCNDQTSILTVRATATSSTLKCDVSVGFGGDTVEYGCQGSP